ncbi:Uncharacterised protein [Mycobacteroides abscessus subsp. abscessus]|nr:Uncharacterised protein [Mycobacteroides abscessus subsp. abscessus]
MSPIPHCRLDTRTAASAQTPHAASEAASPSARKRIPHPQRFVAPVPAEDVTLRGWRAKRQG